MVSPIITLDPTTVEQMISQAVEDNISTAIENLGQDPDWLEKIERQVNQAVVDRVVRQFGQIDLNPIIKERVDENMHLFQQDMLKNFTSTGITDQTTTRQLTITDDDTVVENQLTAKNLNIAKVAIIQDLVVRGSVNIDNPSWVALADGISEKTIEKLTDSWKSALVAQVTEHIKTSGIDFDRVTSGGELLVDGNKLSNNITDTNIQSVGTLRTLEVGGEAVFNNQTLSVLNKRIGVNTQTPEMALGIWDEEVSIVIGKNRANEAYIGTNRAQAVAIGVNRQPQIELTADGLTRIKQLQVGVHRISHADIVPGWSGTKGDIVFNSNPGADSVFAWVCLGAYRWKPLRSAE
jgi:hypothetical protein